jgi:hypothetical protein
MERNILILRRLLVILVVAVFHLATTIYFVAMAFMDGMTRFDTGSAVTTMQRITAALARILTFPLVWLLDVLPSRGAETHTLDTVVFSLNSLLWGAAVYGGFWGLNRWLRKRRSAQADNPALNS